MRNGLAERLSQPGIRFKALPLGSKLALGFLLLIALVAIFAPVLAPHDPLATDGAPIGAPNSEYLFGTDEVGRDILSRLMYGARASLQVGLGAVALALIMGGILGSIAATSSKAASEVVMRIMDILMAFPGIALAAVLLASLGNSVGTIILTIAIVYTPQLARVVRAQVLAAWTKTTSVPNESWEPPASTSSPSTSSATPSPRSWFLPPSWLQTPSSWKPPCPSSPPVCAPLPPPGVTSLQTAAPWFWPAAGGQPRSQVSSFC